MVVDLGGRQIQPDLEPKKVLAVTSLMPASSKRSVATASRNKFVCSRLISIKDNRLYKSSIND